MNKRYMASSLFVIAACTCPASAVHAQQSANDVADTGGGLHDIVVTAEKRSNSLQRTPVAVTAITPEQFAAAQLHTIEDFQGAVPSLQVGSSSGIAQITVRGIGVAAVLPGSESAVAVNINDVYVSRPSAQLTSFFDVAGVEVLRGPQGTLYGRNATAGSLNIQSVRPTDDLSGYVRLQFGNYKARYAEAALGGPIVADKILVRVAALGQLHSGYGHNIVTGTDIDNKRAYAMRGTVELRPTEDLTATIIGEYYHQRDNSGGPHFIAAYGFIGLPGQSNVLPVFQRRGGYVNSELRDQTASFDPEYFLKTWSTIGILEWKHDDVSVKSVTGYRYVHTTVFSETSVGFPTVAGLYFNEEDKQFTQELNLNYDSDRLHVTAGLFYMDENDDAQPIFGIAETRFANSTRAPNAQLPFPPDQFLRSSSFSGVIDTKAKAAFAQATYNFTPEISLTAGMRYSTERKNFEGRYQTGIYDLFVKGVDPVPVPAVYRSAKFSAWTPKIGLQYQITPKTLAYASYSKGFRAGTFDISSGPTVPALKPEKLTDYEAGIKTTMLEDQLRINLAGFYYDYSNLVVTRSTGILIALTNAGNAKLYGMEAEIVALPTRDWQIELNGSLLHSEFGSYRTTDTIRPNLPRLGGPGSPDPATIDFKGNKLPNAPTFRGRFASQYTLATTGGKITARGELDYVSRIFFAPNNLDIQSQRANAKINAFLTYASDDNWRVQLYGRNLTDKITVISNAGSNQYGSVLKGLVSAPRTFGIEFGYSF